MTSPVDRAASKEARAEVSGLPILHFHFCVEKDARPEITQYTGNSTKEYL